MDTGVIIVFLLVFLVSLLVVGKKRMKLPPGQFTMPIVGTLGLLRQLKGSRVHEVFSQEARRVGAIFKFSIGTQLCVVLNGYDMIHEAFVNQAEFCSSRPTIFTRVTGNSGEDGIIFNEYGDSWRELRRFTIQALRDFGVGKMSIEETISTELEALTSFLLKHEGKPVRIGPPLQQSVSNVIFSIVFGKRYDLEDPEFVRILALSEELISGSGALNPVYFYPRWVQAILSKMMSNAHSVERKRKEFLTNEIRTYIYKHIDDHEASFDPDNIRDFVDIYWQSSKQKQGSNQEKKYVTKENMYKVIFDLFLGGTETTSTTLDWACLYMIQYPHVQTKCQDEIQAVFGERTLTYADRTKLPYTFATLMEIQRYGNTVPLAAPHWSTEDFVCAGYDIPKGTMIMGNIFSANMDENYFTQPETFNPNRFLDASGKLIKVEALVPFSLGPRVCAGESLAKMEMFLLFTGLLQRFKLSREEPHTQLSTQCRPHCSNNVTQEYKLRALTRA